MQDRAFVRLYAPNWQPLLLDMEPERTLIFHADVMEACYYAVIILVSGFIQ